MFEYSSTHIRTLTTLLILHHHYANFKYHGGNVDGLVIVHIIHHSSFIMVVTLLSSIGIILCLYSLYVEHQTHLVEESDGELEFVALCDIESIGASCSTVFALPEGKLLSYFNIVAKDSSFDIPNGFLGLAYYCVCIIRATLLPKTNELWDKAQLLASLFSLASSIFLAIRLTQLRELCIVCWTTHVINASLFFTFLRRVLYFDKRKSD